MFVILQSSVCLVLYRLWSSLMLLGLCDSLRMLTFVGSRITVTGYLRVISEVVGVEFPGHFLVYFGAVVGEEFI